MPADEGSPQSPRPGGADDERARRAKRTNDSPRTTRQPSAPPGRHAQNAPLSAGGLRPARGYNLTPLRGDMPGTHICSTIPPAFRACVPRSTAHVIPARDASPTPHPQHMPRKRRRRKHDEPAQRVKTNVPNQSEPDRTVRQANVGDPALMRQDRRAKANRPRPHPRLQATIAPARVRKTPKRPTIPSCLEILHAVRGLIDEKVPLRIGVATR